MTATPDTAQMERLVDDFGNAVVDDCCWYSMHRDSEPQRTALLIAIRELVRERDELRERLAASEDKP